MIHFRGAIVQIVFIFLMFTACSEGTTYQNNKEHVKLGQDYAGKFYKEISTGNFEKAALRFSNQVPKTDVLSLLKQNRELFGKLNEIKFITATSQITEKNHQLNGEMTLTFEAVYTRLTTTENLSISVEHDSLLIEGYDYKVNVEKIGK
jgi:hypothetical protein